MLKRKQVNIGGWWGNLLLAIGQISQVVGLFTMSFAGIAAYPTVKEWFLDFSIDLKLWHFVTGIVILLAVAVGMAWVFGLASFFSQWNKQFWSHDNPIRQWQLDTDKRIYGMESMLKNLCDKENTDAGISIQDADESNTAGSRKGSRKAADPASRL